MRLFGNAIQNYYGTLSITTPGGGLLAINSAGNVSIGAPASGTPLTITNLSGANVAANIASSDGSGNINLIPGSGAGGYVGLIQTNATGFQIGHTSTGRTLDLLTGTGARLTVGGQGNVTIRAPDSAGASLALFALSNTVGLSYAGDGVTIGVQTASTPAGFIGATSNHPLNITTNNASRISISAAGAVTVNAPASGTAFTVNAVAGAIGMQVNGAAGAAINALLVQGSTTSGSRGMLVQAGNNSGDICFLCNNAAASLNYFNVQGDGAVLVGSPTGGGQGIGTVNATGLFINAGPVYSGIPQNSQSAAYTLVLADANKHIYHPSADTTARTWTIPANASVAFPIGTAVTFDNDTSAGVITLAITTDTLVWLPSGTTGSRTIAANGQATALKVTATRWHLTGVGIT